MTETYRSTIGAGNPLAPTRLASRTRKRSRVACRGCHERKVRCNVAQAGPPCFNCSRDEISCEVAPRKRHAPAPFTKSRQLFPLTEPSKPAANNNTLSHLSSLSRLTTQSETQSFTESELNASNAHVRDIDSRSSTADGWPYSSSNPGNPERDEGENCESYAIALAGNFKGKDSIPFYVGDQVGFHFLSDICQTDPGPKTSHYLVPKAIVKSLSAEDLAFLRLKGAFSLPDDEVCRELIRCYFHYVHPYMPIIDASSFIDKYVKGAEGVNLLLLWSMFFAGASFVDKTTLKKANCTSRKDMKRQMYQRAKALYDFDYEIDKIVLIQSVILLGFWLSDTEDRTGSWHWIGIAIGLCQSIGLHRNPKGQDALDINSNVRFQYCLWRRIWWSCHSREAWLSLGMGRPMRINIEDCDTPLPSAQDFLIEWAATAPGAKKAYFPENEETLALSWVSMTKIHVVLGNVLAKHYRPRDIMPTVAEIELCAEEIASYSGVCQNQFDPQSIAALMSSQLQLHYNAIMITLYRPYILQFPGDLMNATPERHAEWQSYAIQKARSAANDSNSIINQLIASDLIQFCPSTTVTAMLPPMQIHLLEYTSDSFLRQKLAENQLNMCMLVMTELQKTYWAADFAFKFYSEARDKQTVIRQQRLLLGNNESADKPRQGIGKQKGQQSPRNQFDINDDPLLLQAFLPNDWNLFAMLPEISENDADVSPDININSVLSSEDFDRFAENCI